MLIKNTFGLSAVLGIRQTINLEENMFTGSALDRKKLTEEEKQKRKLKTNQNKEEGSRESAQVAEPSTWIDMETGEEITVNPTFKLRTMSRRTKSKIRKKLMAFSQLYKKLTFVTLTFVNSVDDRTAVKLLRKFLDNMKKRAENFDYLWVIERQTKNTVFEANVHFHLITNKYWNIKQTWQYWLDVQRKNGIHPRDDNFKPSSAFDVKQVSTKNPRQIASYLTKYVTKNNAEFDCQVWNCSQGISNLYTDFYTGPEFLDELYRIKGEEIKEVPLEYCTLHLIPLDKTTFRFYDRLEEKNKTIIHFKS